MSHPWGDDEQGNSWASRIASGQSVRPKAQPSDPNTAPQQWPSLASAVQVRSGGNTPASGNNASQPGQFPFPGFHGAGAPPAGPPPSQPPPFLPDSPGHPHNLSPPPPLSSVPGFTSGSDQTPSDPPRSPPPGGIGSHMQVQSRVMSPPPPMPPSMLGTTPKQTFPPLPSANPPSMPPPTMPPPPGGPPSHVPPDDSTTRSRDQQLRGHAMPSAPPPTFSPPRIATTSPLLELAQAQQRALEARMAEERRDQEQFSLSQQQQQQLQPPYQEPVIRTPPPSMPPPNLPTPPSFAPPIQTQRERSASPPRAQQDNSSNFNLQAPEFQSRAQSALNASAIDFQPQSQTQQPQTQTHETSTFNYNAADFVPGHREPSQESGAFQADTSGFDLPPPADGMMYTHQSQEPYDRLQSPAPGYTNSPDIRPVMTSAMSTPIPAQMYSGMQQQQQQQAPPNIPDFQTGDQLGIEYQPDQQLTGDLAGFTFEQANQAQEFVPTAQQGGYFYESDRPQPMTQEQIRRLGEGETKHTALSFLQSGAAGRPILESSGHFFQSPRSDPGEDVRLATDVADFWRLCYRNPMMLQDFDKRRRYMFWRRVDLSSADVVNLMRQTQNSFPEDMARPLIDPEESPRFSANGLS